jgi:hypothetical protein
MICSAISWMWALCWMQEGIGYFHALTISPSLWWTPMNSFFISIIWFSKKLYYIWWTTMNSFFIWITWFSKDLYWFSYYNQRAPYRMQFFLAVCEAFRKTKRSPTVPTRHHGNKIDIDLYAWKSPNWACALLCLTWVLILVMHMAFSFTLHIICLYELGWGIKKLAFGQGPLWASIP